MGLLRRAEELRFILEMENKIREYIRFIIEGDPAGEPLYIEGLMTRYGIGEEVFNLEWKEEPECAVGNLTRGIRQTSDRSAG